MEFKTGQIIEITIGAYSDATTYDVEVLQPFTKEDCINFISLIKEKEEGVYTWHGYTDAMLLFYLEHKGYVKRIIKNYDGWLEIHYGSVGAGDTFGKDDFYDEHIEFIREYF